MLRTSITRAAGSSLRQSVRSSQASPAALVTLSNAQQTRQAHAISNPTLANIEKRWEAMPPQEQADLWMALRDRMKVDWHELTTQEKRAGTWKTYTYHVSDFDTIGGHFYTRMRLDCCTVMSRLQCDRYCAKPQTHTTTPDINRPLKRPDKLTKDLYSLLDCFRSPRSTCPATSG